VSRIILGVLLGLVLGAAGAMTLVKYPQVADLLRRAAAEPEPQAEAPADESFLEHDANGVTLVKLDADTQTRIGLKVAALQTTQAPAEASGFGRVLDPTPLAALVADGASAQASLTASTKEYERVKTLYSQDRNASARALETAEAAKSRDQIALESVRSRLLLGWGQEIAARADLPAFVNSLAARQIALVRVDLPAGEIPQTPPTGGRIALLTAPANMIEIEVVGPAPTADPQLQTVGFFCLARGPGPAPGTAVTAWLALPGQIRTGVIVPCDALLRHEGETFVYLQTGDDTFQRQAVVLDRPTGDGWFVDQGLQPQQKVVVVGAQELLSEELKGQGGEEE
jgi:hypothetical protein